ncbi:FtsK/SpoIIIE domain-containing protein [Asanoa sp. WMMD1127]|uniref:FtsK/SpoIIIE domain-containing protein n=1 Tax=Asanoa sp. WMMD1127 TaxID=3016107 RepID=UPI002416AD78|nr:FtsK/SpoIIIE domain-containing protein [Asanoa sp. WMMD1127]MDG4825746.1 FtsK/SpoIIIE domain-containing protein [Asanoa sp. WMMD1127]
MRVRLSVCDRRGNGGQMIDVTLGAVAADATVAELLAQLTGSRPTPSDEVDLDGTPVDSTDRLVDLPWWAGSVLTVRSTHLLIERPTSADRPVVDLVRVAGPDTGLALPLTSGTFAVGRTRTSGLTHGPVARPIATLEIDPDGAVRIAGTGRVDGREVTGDDPVDGTFLRVADAAFRLAPATGRRAATLDAAPDEAGREQLIRTPRVAGATPPAHVPVPPPPAPAAVPAPLSWLLLIAPLPIGIVMAFVFSPFFLVMVAMTPMMALARWVESRHRAKKDKVRIAVETAAAAERFAADLDAIRARIAAAARLAHPDLADLGRRAVDGRGLWEVRPGDPDELRVPVGVGARGWLPELGRRGGDELAGRPELAEALAGRAWLDDVPLHVDLRERTGLGAVGPDARRVVATVVLDLVIRHGPADLALALVVEPAHLGEWDWLKWLPHLAGDDGTLRVATEPAAAEHLLTRVVADTAPPARGAAAPARPTGTTVVVVDGDDLLTGRVAALLGRLARGSGRALVVASTRDRLPSVCGAFLELGPDGTAELTDAITGERTTGLLAARAAGAVCRRTARALARWTDPEQAAAAALLPTRARLVELLKAVVASPQGLARPVDDLDSTVIEAWWRRDSRGLEATIGVTERGPFTLDLLADGPHGLVVGTTGAGKSELLRTVVASLACAYSPDDLTFLLVDFKGGGAFDACAGLPHTVGLVTDLDEHLAARALRCLRAEVRHRERRLREAGVSDLGDLVAPDRPLPRLLIVIDEFATLAVELPGFLSALVDVAQRGRSLGIHLLLATQRPQGVVDGKIRANTNLRVALRVQDEADSRDVLGTKQAADIDRRRPGRAYVRLGASEVVGVQTALVSASTPQGQRDRIEVTPFALVSELEPAPADVPGVPTDLERLSAAIAEAAQLGGYQPPRVPWPPPLATEVDAWTLPAGGADDAVPIGTVDLPDEQRSDVWRWSPDAGGTLVLAADPAAVGAALTTAVLGLARCRPPDRQQVFVLAGIDAGLRPLADLPHVVAVVGVDEREQLGRVLDRVEREIAARRAGGPRGADVLVVVVGWDALVEGAEQAGIVEAGARLERFLRDGAPVGVRLLVSAAHERGVPGRVLTQLATKLCLRLADAASYTALGLRARDVPELAGLRAIDLQTRHELQIGRYGPDAVARIAAAYPGAAPTGGVTVLPELVPAGEVLPASTVVGQTWRLGVGRHYRDLAVATMDLGPGMHAVVAGPAGSGRTSALRLLAAAARAGDPAATVAVVTADPDVWAGAAVTCARAVGDLPPWTAAGRGLLLVDGMESLGPDAGTALDRLLPGLSPGVHLVVAGRADTFRGMQPWQRAVTMSRTGLLLRPAADDGEVLRIRLPREAPPRPLPGRGYLVEAGGLAQVQVAMLPLPPAPLTLPVGVFAGGAR